MTLTPYETIVKREKRARTGDVEDRPGLAFEMCERWDLSALQDILLRRSSMLDPCGAPNIGLEKLLDRIKKQMEGSSIGDVTGGILRP